MGSRRISGAVGKTLIAGIGAVAVSLLLSGSPAGADTIRDCDFNGDGLDDLAVGAPRLTIDRVRNAGAVLVYHGTRGIGRPFFVEPIGEITVSRPQPNERLGSIQVCGDFDGDGYSDLVMGQPYWSFDGDRTFSGRVTVLYGGPGGLDRRRRVLVPGQAGLGGAPAAGALFGFDLTIGDFDGDGFTDLAVGAPGTSVAGRKNAGAVHVIYGGPRGLGRVDRIVHQNSPGMKDRSEAGDYFGLHLTAGDVGGSGATDLIVGIPFENVGPKRNAGAVHVVLGVPRRGRLRNQFIHRDLPGAVGFATTDEFFGAPLYVGNFFGDDHQELVVGVPAQTIAGKDNAGAVHLFAGSARGIRMRGNRVISRATRGVPGSPKEQEQFGRSLVAGVFQGGRARHLDLAVGVPGARSPRPHGGSVLVLYGNGRGRFPRAAELRPSLFANDGYGTQLARGDFNGDGQTDLVMGAPFGFAGNAAVWPSLSRRQSGIIERRQGSRFNVHPLYVVDFSFLDDFNPCTSFGSFNVTLRLQLPESVRSDCLQDPRDIDLGDVPTPPGAGEATEPRLSGSAPERATNLPETGVPPRVLRGEAWLLEWGGGTTDTGS